MITLVSSEKTLPSIARVIHIRGMALSDTSTRSDVVAQYKNNLGYDIAGSSANAGLFIEAARHYVSFWALKEVEQGEEHLTIDTTEIANILRHAQRYASRSNSSGVRHFDLSEFRD